MGDARAATPSEAAASASLRERISARVDRAAWRDAAAAVFTTRIAFLALAYAATWLLASETFGRSTVGFLDMWTKWDAAHFTGIAEHGYFSNLVHPHATAFFPGYPLGIRVISALGAAPALAGMIISAAASLVAGVYLYKLAELDVGEGAGRRALLYLFLFPTAVFLVAPYSEALFLAGAIPAFYLARTGRWHLAGIPAAVAMGARFAGVFLLIGLAVEFLAQRDFTLTRIANLFLTMALGALPLLAYMIFLANTTGNPLDFIESQRLGWGRDLVGPVQSFRATWQTWYGSYETNWLFAWRVEILAAGVGVFFTVWAFLKRWWGYGGYMLATLGALMASSWYFSIPRMLLSLFPIVLLLAAFTRGSDRRHEATLIVLAPAAALGVVVFTQGIWFF